MAIKKRLLATAAIPFLAIAGVGLPASAGVVRPLVTIEAKSPIISVQSEEELPKKRRNRENQAESQQGAEEQTPRQRRKERQQAQDQQSEQPSDNAGAVEEQPRKNRKQRQQAEEQQLDQPANDSQAEEQQPRKNRKQRQQAEEQQVEQPADNAQTDSSQTEEQPRKKRREQAQQNNAQDGQVSDEEILNQNRKNRKERQQAQDQQQSDEAQPSGNAQTEEQPRKKRRDNQQAQDGSNADNGQVSDEEIMNQNRKRKQRQQAEDQQQSDEAQPSGNADSDQQPRRNRRDNQQAQDGANDGANDGQAVSDEDIVNQNRKRRNRDRADTPEAIQKREQIARDPSKTTDTVVLPVENGAAVLDSDKDADNSGANRERRKRQREEVKEVRAPKSDKDAQVNVNINIKPVVELKGERVDDFRGYRRPEGKLIGKGEDVRVVFDLDGKVVIRSDDRDRIGRNEQIRYERLRDDRIKEIVVRPNGDRIVTIRNRWGEIIRRSRIDNRETEVVIFYSPDLDEGRDRLFLRDPGDELPPMRLNVPIDDYIINVSGRRDRNYDYQEFLAKPPVERVERVYSVDEVKNSARIRDKVRRIDLDTITFETGSADIDREQASTLREVATAINDLLDRNPGETFLIEGHTDAVGSDESNLVLSDERAESVANVLTELFNIPAENLTTQGYGERYLKIDSDGPVRENRRVTIRRITPLVRPAELSEN